MNTGPFDLTLLIVLGVLLAGVLLAFGRLVVGPSVADRVVALDLIGMLAAGVVCVTAIDSGEPLYLRIAISQSLVAFLGTVGFAYYIWKRSEP